MKSERRESIELTEQKIKENKELAKLRLFGPGPKMQGLGILPSCLQEGKFITDTFLLIAII